MADLARPETRLEFAERVLVHRFADPDLLLQGCTHASRLGAMAGPADRQRRSNERMEFLGDAILGAVVAIALYRRDSGADEGRLSRAKSSLVSRATLARVAERTGLLAHAIIGGQVAAEPPDSVKANLVEGVIGAVFVDGGWDAAAKTVEALLAEALDDATHAEADPRMALQEWSLARYQQLPRYATVRSGGTDHEPEFTATVDTGMQTGTGTGVSRKKAEAAAASRLLAELRQADATAVVPPPG